MNQLSFFEDIDEKEMRRECVYKLVHLYIEKLVKQGEIKEVKRSGRKR
ncbi:hypothetical protein ACQ3VH_11695 [Bacillus pretiosus]